MNDLQGSKAHATSHDQKRILIVGAGAVGQLLGCLIGARGHEVTFLLKPGRVLGEMVIRDLDRAQTHRFKRPNTIIAGDVIEAPNYVIVAVRGDQIDDALMLTRPYLAAHTSVAVVPPLMDDLFLRVQKAGIIQPSFAMLIGFGAWPVGDELHWFRFPEGAVLLSCEGDAGTFAAAKAFEAVLREAGLRAHSAIVMPPIVRAMVAGEKALLMGWALAGWDIDRLIAERALCALTAAAMEEAVRAVLAGEPDATDTVLASMPSLEQRANSMSENMRTIWRYHGPKISQQTQMMVDALIDNGRRRGVGIDNLKTLRAYIST